MKVVLFCQNAYSFAIMKPLKDEIKRRGYTYTWFIMPKLKAIFPFENDLVTSSIQALEQFKSDAIICPGNEVPYYLRGLKVQIFHGLAGEKKGHFRIRNYFDLYLTQGPYFTNGFNKLKEKYKNFEVIETGWPKLDTYEGLSNHAYKEKNVILTEHDAQSLLLYAPTFSPSLTSAHAFKVQIEQLAQDARYVIHIKFHDLMEKGLIDYYKNLAQQYENVYFIQEKDIVKQLLIADVLISDTSSVIYEFLLLDKPAITLNNIATEIKWQNITDPCLLSNTVSKTISQDPFSKERAAVIAQYHPYNDGNSSQRVLDTITTHIKNNRVPEERKLSWLRRRKINNIFDRKS